MTSGLRVSCGPLSESSSKPSCNYTWPAALGKREYDIIVADQGQIRADPGTTDHVPLRINFFLI